MHSDSSEIQRLSHNWVAITWQLGDRERQLRRGLVSPEERLSDILQRALMEACVMGYLNKKIAFTEPDEFSKQWQVVVFRDGKEIELPLEQKVEELSLSAGERLILRPLSSTEGHRYSVDDLPGATGLPQSFVTSPSRSSSWLTYFLTGVVVLLVVVVVLVLVKL